MTFGTEGTFGTKPLLREGGQGDRLINDLSQVSLHLGWEGV
jgi:hypothetical protein